MCAQLIFSLVIHASVVSHAVMVQQKQTTQFRGNPIRKVVTMLQKMQAQVEEEGKREADLHHQFMCYCSKSDGALSHDIEASKAKIESLVSAIEASKEKLAQTEQDLKHHQVSKHEAEDAMAQAKGIREKEAAAFAEEQENYRTNLAALGKAISAVKRGMAGAFLQTGTATTLRTFVMEQAELPDETRDELLAFLSDSQAEDYVPQSGEIVGILETMNDEVTKNLAEASSHEKTAIKAHQGLMAAKNKEVDALYVQISEEQTRIGDLEVEIASMKHDLEDSRESLADDSKFVADLAKSCKIKAQQWEEVEATRAEELVALSETIKVLNDDDALELFKKTLPSAGASLMQIDLDSQSIKALALDAVHAAADGKSNVLPPRPELDLIALALIGKKNNFEKVISMVDEMLANLKKEQDDDDRKKEYCETQLDIAEDKEKQLKLSAADSETAIDEMKGSIAKLIDEIALLEDGIKKLDKSVAEATAQRKSENSDYKQMMKNDSAAIEILLWVKNRLNKFYNPAAAPALVQIGSQMHSKNVPPPPPETFGAYSKKTGASSAVISLIDHIIRDLKTELTEAKKVEENAQHEYEGLMAEAGTKRAGDSKSLTDKASAKAAEEGALEAETEAKKGTEKELMGTLEYIHTLHGECDFLLKFYEARAKARAGEIDALKQAKAVLSGTD